MVRWADFGNYCFEALSQTQIAEVAKYMFDGNNTTVGVHVWEINIKV